MGGIGRARARAWRAVGVAAVAFVAVLVLVPAGSAALNDTHLLSRADGAGGAAGNGPSGAAAAITGAEAVSDDGCRVAFSSAATNFGVGPPNVGAGGLAQQHAYVRDRCTGETIYASAAADDAARHPGAPTTIQSISGDGTKVAFITAARMDPETDKNSLPDVYLRDLEARTTTLVSVGLDGRAAGVLADAPSLSGDGHHVSFTSAMPAGELVAGVSETGAEDADVFVRDTAAEVTTLASAGAGSSAPGNAASRRGSLSDDGTAIAFETAATDLFPGDTNDRRDVVVKDLVAGAVALASRGEGPEGEQGEANAGAPALSGDGGTVAFACGVCGFDEGERGSNVYARNLASDSLELASRASGAAGAPVENAAAELSISDDGRYVTFGSADHAATGASAGTPLAYARDLATGGTTLASRGGGELGAAAAVDFAATQPGISGDGSLVAFATAAGGLDPTATDTNGVSDLYAREVAFEPVADTTPPTATISSGPSGTVADASATFEFASDEVGSSFECRLDGADFEPCSSPKSYEGLDDGEHTFAVRATDLAGNTGPAATHTWSIDTSSGEEPPEELPPPEEGSTANAYPVEGTVKVNGAPLERPEQIEVASKIDTRNGRVRLVTNYNDKLQEAEFYGALWKFDQEAGDRPFVEMNLGGPNECSSAEPAVSERKRRRGRRGWGSGRGRYRSRGRRGSGSVRGTTWLTFDRCDGSTVFKVREGRVFVDDFAKRGKVNARLEAGQRYVAKRR